MHNTRIRIYGAADKINEPLESIRAGLASFARTRVSLNCKVQTREFSGGIHHDQREPLDNVEERALNGGH